MAMVYAYSFWTDLNGPLLDEVWPDARNIQESVLTQLLTAAHEVCEAYAPPASMIPMSYRMAEIMQARHIWSQFGGGNQTQTGADGFEVGVYPLVFAARDLLRPKRSPLSRLGA